MTWQGWAQIALFVALTTAAVRPLGAYIAAVVDEQAKVLRPFAPFERWLFRLAGVDPAKEQDWLAYASALLAFNLAGIVLLYLVQRIQHVLPLNPQHLDAVTPDLALNTAVSFATNTSWQSYAGEATLSHLTQMVGITVQSFASGATGIAVAIALVRGFARRTSQTIGNFWVDLTRITLYILLPLSVVAGLFLVSQGVPQTPAGYVDATTLEGAHQIVARGPVASQEAIKLMSGDGGGFFNTNSAHPFENPTPLSGLAEMLLIFLIGAPLTYTFGRMVGDQRQGWALLAAMAVMFLAGLAIVYPSESGPNPAMAALPVDQAVGPLQAGGNMEGKEVRFGPGQSAGPIGIVRDHNDRVVGWCGQRDA